MQPLPALITILALILYFILTLNVGKARSKYGIHPPATTGNEEFERRYRVQMNTLEHIVIFLPTLWICALIWPAPHAASLFGIIWIVGRIMYAIGYYKEPALRTKGFFLSVFATVALTLGSLIGIMKAFLVG